MALYIQTSTPDGTSRIQDIHIVLIHGGASSHRMYRDVVPILTSNGYTVHCPDLLGHGQSKQLGSFTFEQSTSLLYTAIQNMQSANNKPKTVLVAISLGGQAALHYLSHHPETIDAALVSGVFIHPPSDSIHWAMPHLPDTETPEGKEWMKIIMEDVGIMGMENAQALQQQAFGFRFSIEQSPQHDSGTTGVSESREKRESDWPPTLAVVGEHDMALPMRDFDEVTRLVKARNEKSQGRVLEGAWHNHSIDVPDKFAALIVEWTQQILPSPI